MREIEEHRSDRGRTTAAFNIYCMYRQKRIDPPGTDEDLMKFLHIAADGGDEGALHDLGLYYMWGKYGLTPDREKAEQLLRSAMEKSEQGAKFPLMHLKASQKSPEAKQEAIKLFHELLVENPQFKSFIEDHMKKVKEALNESEQEDSGEDGNSFQEKKEEKEESEYVAEITAVQQESKGPQISSESLTTSSSSEEEYTEEEWKKHTGKEKAEMTSTLPQGEPQQPSILSRQEQQEQAEMERLQRKY